MSRMETNCRCKRSLPTPYGMYNHYSDLLLALSTLGRWGEGGLGFNENNGRVPSVSVLKCIRMPVVNMMNKLSTTQ